MWLSFLACAGAPTKPTTKPTTTPHSTPDHSGTQATAHSAASGCDSGAPVEGEVRDITRPGGNSSTRCWSETTSRDLCDLLGWPALLGGCLGWDALRQGIVDGTITVITPGYPLYPPTDLEVVTCTRPGDGDWHWLYVEPYQYYDAGARGLLFDGSGQLAAVVEYAAYYGAWCCETQVVYSRWFGVETPGDLTCDDGAPLAP